jgi:YVTN family beta-propeller protein
VKVFVTGAIGPICGAVVEALRDTGHKLLGLVRFEVKAVVPEERQIKTISSTLAGSAGQSTLNKLNQFIIHFMVVFTSLACPSSVFPQERKQGDDDSQFTKQMVASMQIMDKDMVAAPINGDPDHDFTTMMIPHHQGAIDMAKAVLLHGKDPVIRRLAQEIIVTQQQEIEVMRLRLATFQTDTGVECDPICSTPLAVSSQDRVYVAEQTSDTVSVIDPASNKLLGVIRLGDPVPGALSPLYRGQLLVHGLGFSPDHRKIAVVSIGSNSITFIDTESNKILGVVYVGRSPHEAFFTPDGKELWAAVRGENYISVIDPVAMKEIRRVQTANGPGMVLFRPDGRYAFVPSSFTPELDVVDMRNYEVIARVPQASPFSPNLAVSCDGTEVWFTLKDSGKVQVMSAQPPFQILNTLDAGPICNHVTLVDNANGKFAYVTVGGENVVKVYSRGEKPSLVATISTGDLPHGIWVSGDGTRVYVGLENQDEVIAIDTLANKIIATIPVGQQPQALVYVPGAVPSGDGTANLTPLGDAGEAGHLTLIAPDANGNSAHATVSVNNLGLLDLLQIGVSGLKPGHKYTLWLVESRTAPFGQKEGLVTFQANVSGAQIAQAIGPLRHALTSNNQPPDKQRFLMITQTDSERPEMIQRPL